MPSSAVQTCALRSEEHTSELQSHDNLVCRLLPEKNNIPTSGPSILTPLHRSRWDPFLLRAAQPAAAPSGAWGPVNALLGGGPPPAVFFLKAGPAPGPSPLPHQTALPL